MARNLNWFKSGEALSLREIKNAEDQLRLKFPFDYIDLISEHAGGSPEECIFSFIEDGKRQNGNFGFLLSLEKEPSQNVFETLEALGDRLPRGLFPIIETGMGDLVCLDYRTSDTPAIVYFVHDVPIEESVCFIANTFSEFLEQLTVPED